jgi:uncharacterized protein (DUF58 family)
MSTPLGGRWSPPKLSVAGIALTGRGWAFLLGGVLAVLVAYGARRPELTYVGVLLIALPALAVGYVLLRRPRLDVTRGFAPAIVPVGRTTSARARVRNRGRTLTSPVQWADTLPFAPGATAERDLARIDLARPAELEYEVRAPRRGVFGIGPFVTELVDPFHLARAVGQHGGTQELVVTPEAVPLPETGLTVPAGSGEARLVQRRSTGDEDDAITREYRSGDAMRRVHWRATARHGELMVRQEEQRSLPHARILVDTLADGYLDADDGDESESFEWVVRMLASVAVHLRRAGFLVTVLETGDRQLTVERRRTWGDEEFLAGLASFELQDRRGAHRDEARGDGPLIALAGTPGGETVEWMRRHRRPGSLAAAFLAQPLTAVDRLDRSFGGPARSGDAGERLLDDGWLVVPVRADEDHAAAWGAVVMETGRARGA